MDETGETILTKAVSGTGAADQAERATRERASAIASEEVTQPAPETAEARAERRRRRLERLEQASTISFTLETPVRRFVEEQARSIGMDMAHFMQKMVENHILLSAPKGDPLALRLQSKRLVIDSFVDLARKLEAEGHFDDQFILTVFRAAEQDEALMQHYRNATDVAGAPARAAARTRVSLNQQLGRLVKRAVGARSKRNEKGRIMRGQTPDALVTTYTLLEKPPSE
ncbi:hypothetical protein R5H30_03180 [Sulfitobacter sp. D35]|uniref:hypothetical protein n=1 Tax=Sulfitobacter sp. D35 TaxID=3083252 RepID=UPI0029700445|nr:hypothetical protein [Sulfitobacter sp. D35]MDW4496972.1 hypothetical protein [Sulfitobacter sp. D35]